MFVFYFSATLMAGLLLKVLLENSLVKILLFMELIGMIWLMNFLIFFKADNMMPGVDLLLFSLLVFEGLIGLYGVILLFNFSSVSMFAGKNL